MSRLRADIDSRKVKDGLSNFSWEYSKMLSTNQISGFEMKYISRKLGRSEMSYNSRTIGSIILNNLSRMLSSNHIGEFLTIVYIPRKMGSVSLTFSMFIEIQGRFIGDLKSFGKLWS